MTDSLPSPELPRLIIETPCKWRFHKDIAYPRLQSWLTDCGNWHSFTDQDLDEIVTPQSQKFCFCPYCGCKLEVERGR